MEIVTKTAINEIMLSDQSTNEKAYKIASQVEWVDGLSKETVTEALILVLQAKLNIVAVAQLARASETENLVTDS